MITLSENFRALFYAPFYAAHAIGAFQQEGVEVAHRDTANPGQATADLLSGRTDVMWGGPLRVLLTHQDDPSSDIVCFCDVVARDPFFVIGSEPRPDFTIADLGGVRFGSVSEVPTPWLCLQVDTGAGHVWYAAADRGLTAYTTLVTRRATLAARRDELAAMVRAMYRALRWIGDTSGAEVARVLASYFPDVPPALFASAIDRYRALHLYGPDPVTRREGFDRLAAAMLSGGALKSLIPFEECVDNSLAEAAMA